MGWARVVLEVAIKDTECGFVKGQDAVQEVRSEVGGPRTVPEKQQTGCHSG